MHDCIKTDISPDGEDTYALRLISELIDLRARYAKWIRRAKARRATSHGSSVSMMHWSASYLRRDIEVVITRRSWKTTRFVTLPPETPWKIRTFGVFYFSARDEFSHNSRKLYLRSQVNIRRDIEAVTTRRSWKLPSYVYVISWKPLILLGFSHHRMHFARSVSRSFLAIFLDLDCDFW